MGLHYGGINVIPPLPIPRDGQWWRVSDADLAVIVTDARLGSTDREAAIEEHGKRTRVVCDGRCNTEGLH